MRKFLEEYMWINSIDAQAFNNYYEDGYGNSAKSYYASDWANSSLRAWLNDDFYNTAFSATEKSKIGITNNATKGIYDNEFDSANTEGYL